MTSTKSSNGTRPSKVQDQRKPSENVYSDTDGATTSDTKENPKIFCTSGIETTSLPSLDKDLGGDQETCYPKDGFHSNNHGSGICLPNDGYDFVDNSSKDMYIPQHLGYQDVLDDGPPFYTENGIPMVQQDSYSKAVQVNETVGGQPMDRNHVLLGNLTNETTHFVELPHHPVIQPQLRDLQRLSPEYIFDPLATDIGYPTPPYTSADCKGFQIECPKEVKDDLVGNQVPLKQQQGIKLEDGHPVKSEPESLLASTVKRGAKRSASGYESDGENSRLSKQSKTSEDVDEATQRSLACPFYKHNSNKYHDCRQNLLRRIKDVKQHVFRKHRKPDFYCPICFKTFNDATMRDGHILERRCAPQLDPVYDGISEEQKKTLSQYLSRGKTIEAQWNDMWRVIFPKASPPNSPYLGNYREEMIPLIRELWNDKRVQIISSAFTKNSCIHQHVPFISSLMEQIFDLFELESSQWARPKGAANHYELKADSPPSQIDDAASDVYLNTQNIIENLSPHLEMSYLFHGEADLDQPGLDETSYGSTSSESLCTGTQFDVMESEAWQFVDFRKQL